jgi:type I restriction enzyme, S subunit
MINLADENLIPPGWEFATISDLISKDGIFIDGDWIESKDQDQDGDVRLIQLADIGDGNFKNKSARFLTNQRAQEIGCTFLKKKDILIARMPDPLGRACIFPLEGERRYVTAVDVCIVRLNENSIDEKYLTYLINSPAL